MEDAESSTGEGRRCCQTAFILHVYRYYSCTSRTQGKEKEQCQLSSGKDKVMIDLVMICDGCECECRRGRESGVRDESEVEAPDQLFDYVTEEEYSKLVQKRQAEGFILDDGELMNLAL